MENNEFKIVSTKNRTCYYLDDIIKIEDLDFDNILLDKKSYENVLIYIISSRTFISAEPLRIFVKVDGFMRVYDGARYLVLFGPENYAIDNRIIYLLSQKVVLTIFFYHIQKSKLIHGILYL